MENISPFDLVVLVGLALATFWGGLKGIVSQVASLLSWVVSWLVASRYCGVVAAAIPVDAAWRQPVAAILLFAATAVAFAIGIRFLKRGISLAGLKEFDRQMGALFGLIKGALICVVATFFLTILSEKTRSLVEESKSGPFFAEIAAVAVDAVPETKLGDEFKRYVAESRAERAANGESTLEGDVDRLKTYLEKNVLSEDAAAIVADADAEAEAAESGKTSVASKLNEFWARLKNSSKPFGGDSGGDSNDGGDSGSNEQRSRSGYFGGGASGFGSASGGATNERTASASNSSNVEDASAASSDESGALSTFFRRLTGDSETSSGGANVGVGYADGTGNAGVSGTTNAGNASAIDESSRFNSELGLTAGARASEQAGTASASAETSVAPAAPGDSAGSIVGRRTTRVQPPVMLDWF